MPRVALSKVYDAVTIPKSSAPAVTIASLLDLTDRQLDGVEGVEIRSHGASFYYGLYEAAAWTDKATQAAELPYYRECGGAHLLKTFVGAVADALITGVVIEVEFAHS